MRFLRNNYGFVGALAALGAFIWSMVEFVVSPYWEQVHREPDDAIVDYLKELHGENLELLRERMREEIVAEIDSIDSEEPLSPNEATGDSVPVVTAEPEPRTISIDLSVQYHMQKILEVGSKLMGATTASSVLVRVRDGGVIGLASVADGNTLDSFVLARDTLEHGGILRPITAAIAFDVGTYDLLDTVDTSSPLQVGKHYIRDFRDGVGSQTVLDAMVDGSNVATARLAMSFGPEVQQDYFAQLGLLSNSGIEVSGLEGQTPVKPGRWSELSSLTISYGHGIMLNQFHLANFYATIANEGRLSVPTLLPANRDRVPQVFSLQTSQNVLRILEENVARGAATFANSDVVSIGGATGTADKPKPHNRGYYDDRVIATFAAVFPITDPEYVLIVTLDDPETTSKHRTAGWTAVPVATEIINRVWPLLK